MFERIVRALTWPRAPSMRRAETVALEFSGTRVSFSVPLAGQVDNEENQVRKCTYVLEDEALYESVFLDEDVHLQDSNRDVLGFGAFGAEWNIKESVLLKNSGRRGHVGFTVVVNKNERQGSLFEPANLEAAINEELEAHYGPFSSWGQYGRRFRCPEDWFVVTTYGMDWIHYFVAEMPFEGGGRIEWVAPLAETHYIAFSFRIWNYATEKLSATYEAFARGIVSSCRIDYSESAQEAREAARRRVPEARYSPHKAPLAWDIYDLEPERFLNESERYWLQFEREQMAENLANGWPKYTALKSPTREERMEQQIAEAKERIRRREQAEGERRD